jgi:hypothetical protein
VSENLGGGEFFLESLQGLGIFIGANNMGIFLSQIGYWGNNIAITFKKSSIKVSKSEE